MKKVLLAIFFIALVLPLANAATYQCTYRNGGQVNCNAAQSANTYCSQSMTVTGTTTFGTSTGCTNNAPSANGQITCTVNHNGPSNQVRCTNNAYLQSGPTVVGGSAPSCPYTCALNQVSCAGGYAYQQCVPDPSSPGCNKWQTANCVANGPCFSTTNAQLATCMGVQSATITSQNGVYYYSAPTAPPPSTPPSNNPPANNPPANNPPANTPPAGTSGTGQNATPGANYTYNGKTYYVVSSTNPQMDTGNEVCASAGKTCVGYTAFTSDVCKYFHPTATTQSGVDGDKSGFFCNGAPQGGICANNSNQCRTCAACNNGVDCATPIGGLYREMYVECASTDPAGESNDNLAAQYLANVNQIAQYIGDGKVNVDIRGLPKLCIQIANNQIVTTSLQFSACADAKGTVHVNQTAIDAIQNASDPGTEARNQYNAGNIYYEGHNFLESIRAFFFGILRGLI